MVPSIIKRSPTIDEQTLIARCKIVSAFLTKQIAHNCEIKILRPEDVANLQKEWEKSTFLWEPETVEIEFPTSRILVGLHQDHKLLGISESFLEIVGHKENRLNEIFIIRRETTDSKNQKEGNLLKGFVSACFHELNLDLAKHLNADFITSYAPNDNTSRVNEKLGFELDLDDPMAPSYILAVNKNTTLNWPALRR